MTMNLNQKTVTITAILGLVVLGLLTTPVWAQNLVQTTSNEFCCGQTSHQQWMAHRNGSGHHRGGGWTHQGQYGRMYDLNSIETISGTVVSVDSFTPMQGMSGGVHLQLQTGDEIVDVHLGPSWYLENQDLAIEPADQIEVTGSKIDFNQGTAIIAAQVKKGDATLILRDEQGFPMWSGWRRGRLNSVPRSPHL